MIRAVLTDIEGTTSALAFVHDVLFPYARAQLRSFLARRAYDPDVRPLLERVEATAGRALARDEIILQLEQWMDEDRKFGPLKTLQGLIWAEGYAQGELAGHVYDDAAHALRRWHAQSIRLCVYSSGSVQAQELLFRHSTRGDLSGLFSGWFDTSVGAKREPQSYTTIAAMLELPPSALLFLSDVVAELEAARSAGCATCLLVRDGAPPPDCAHSVARSFDEIEPERYSAGA